mmetsp:Transcript_21366/g.27553  ORF Transcript_21366/g.27553 Transcript_21366/m.27553 type:complete len:83 (+) Transcript_21366:257-505(+)
MEVLCLEEDSFGFRGYISTRNSPFEGTLFEVISLGYFSLEIDFYVHMTSCIEGWDENLDSFDDIHVKCAIVNCVMMVTQSSF